MVVDGGGTLTTYYYLLTANKKGDTMSLVEMNIKEFMDEISSSSPAPGGGSASALMGALGSSLGAMVCKLTYKKKKYEAVWERIKELNEKLEEYILHFIHLIDADTEAFLDLMRAFNLPKNTAEEKQDRRYTIEHATEKATQIPLRIMEYAVDVLELLVDVAKDGNKNSITDVGVAALSCFSALEGAMLNVKINLGGLKDERFVKEINKKSSLYYNKGLELKEKISSIVAKSLEK